MKTTQPFDTDARELANRLFATATAILEDATEIAAAGQHPELSAAKCVACARDLQQAANGITTPVEAALVLFKPEVNKN